MGRVDDAVRNIKYAYIETLVVMLSKFLARTVFVYTVGVTYLGVQGLFTNILSVLSLTELGIGTAMNYSLYKPVAEKDYETIKGLMYLYKRAYRWVAVATAIIGLLLIPFLPYMVKGVDAIKRSELLLYYLIFLFNSVSSYFMSYKYSLANAERKNYIQSMVNTLTSLTVNICQAVVLFLFKNFLTYLLMETVIQMLQKVVANYYLNKRYPYLLDESGKRLPKEQQSIIFRNIRALLYHRLGDICVHQTDNILISIFDGIRTVGLVSNYTLIIGAVTKFIDSIFTSTVSALGNVVAIEDVNKQFIVFRVYRFMAFWIYGFATIAFMVLLNPFIKLWLGNSFVIPETAVYLILMDYYFKGHRIAINNFKNAAGIFQPDKYIALIQAIVNLVASSVLASMIGLSGIYIGTLIQGLVSSCSRPIIVYKLAFRRSATEYYRDSVIYLVTLALPLTILLPLRTYVLSKITVGSFAVMTVLVAVITNLIFTLLLSNRMEFRYVTQMINSRLKRG